MPTFCCSVGWCLQLLVFTKDDKELSRTLLSLTGGNVG